MHDIRLYRENEEENLTRILRSLLRLGVTIKGTDDLQGLPEIGLPDRAEDQQEVPISQQRQKSGGANLDPEMGRPSFSAGPRKASDNYPSERASPGGEEEAQGAGAILYKLILGLT